VSILSEEFLKTNMIAGIKNQAQASTSKAEGAVLKRVNKIKRRNLEGSPLLQRAGGELMIKC